jgi:hypothetical protein
MSADIENRIRIEALEAQVEDLFKWRILFETLVKKHSEGKSYASLADDLIKTFAPGGGP